MYVFGEPAGDYYVGQALRIIDEESRKKLAIDLATQIQVNLENGNPRTAYNLSRFLVGILSQDLVAVLGYKQEQYMLAADTEAKHLVSLPIPSVYFKEWEQS